ncbi:MAG: tRNA (adenosine(37)-N6)-threonylcarbamoyltransferase complex ATPase subunit type 1 TsaE [Phycisphaerae bacterium]|nr:tRNA (adenosine(37)-N6)-threonylcarbamoyltransferase complex ATPase subunit type 1 TsaE [Phycisphaerae bacterium]
MSGLLEIVSRSVEETLEIGRALAACLEAGDVAGLIGPLGSGKTHLIKGIAGGLGVADERLVNSPTFVIVNEHEGRLHVYHLDAYRLAGAQELEGLGFEEMCLGGGVVLVEWADRVSEAFESGTLWIELSVTGETRRRISVRTESAALGERLASLGLDRWR